MGIFEVYEGNFLIVSEPIVVWRPPQGKLANSADPQKGN